MAVVVYNTKAVDQPWCRGEVVNVVKGEGLVEVYLVDYGRQVSVSWANLRKIQMQFITFECQVKNSQKYFLFIIAIVTLLATFP